MSLHGGKTGGTTAITPAETGTSPTATQAAALLRSLTEYDQGPNGPGTILSHDGLIGASPAIGVAADATEGHAVLHDQRIIAVDWAEAPDGYEYHWEFPAAPWKGANGLLSALRAKLRAIATP